MSLQKLQSKKYMYLEWRVCLDISKLYHSNVTESSHLVNFVHVYSDYIYVYFAQPTMTKMILIPRLCTSFHMYAMIVFLVMVMLTIVMVIIMLVITEMITVIEIVE